MPKLRFFGLAAALFCVLGSCLVAEPDLVLLVRHAETEADGTRDPALSEAGRIRALRLAELAEQVGIQWCLSLSR